ncbi:flagellar hook-associated protein FlgK [Salinibacterium hongtaonis]|uniref:Flagellar hook-associated protein 1 n=1 Tax=Homoserinimonas hongtaonis TaxID=2079791 RepID=A0A2U1T1U3_9MICO|nr:flagellar hook-associated protein FlgK [Salinibacterium hongtaonis]AWB90396.1 flagellar hook-associated protein FlgK [Salinibacterium hongtaonis]PWB97836.1 flagellar hook-associated protein FlgK [Salinibacterium hongtaonis]
MSTFSGLNTAYTALTAARNGLDVVGQNIANLNTQGYTRQRVTTSSIGGLANVGALSHGVTVGQGVATEGIARLGDIFLDSKVRSSAASSGYWNVRSSALDTIESVLQEPGKNGISNQLQTFWSAWQDVSNRAGEPASASVLLEQAGVLAARIGNGYTEIAAEWSDLRAQTDGMAAELNDAASQVAGLNGRIRSALAAGESVNELMDKRSSLTATIASLAGGTARETADGTVEVLIGGNAIVSGDTFRPISVAGGRIMADGAGDPVRLEWNHRPDTPISLDGGEIAGAIASLAPADATRTGGSLAEAAASFTALAVSLHDRVNAVHRTGETANGSTNLDFFGWAGGVVDARNLVVVATSVDTIASSNSGAGAYNGGIADAISQIGVDPSGPSAVWSTIVTGIGVASRTAGHQADLSTISVNAAIGAQLAHSSVDIDEENINMLSFQLAYQGAARVMTAVDEMLDTLINRTGVVGR